jgi:hypothetical protein
MIARSRVTAVHRGAAMNTATTTKTHAPLESIALHLGPGIAMAAFVFLLAWAAPFPGVPAMFWLQVGALAVGTPLMLLLMKRAAAREGGTRPRDVVSYRCRLRWWEYLLWPALMLAFAAGVMTTLGNLVNPLVRTALFGWLPASWDVSDHLLRPEAYARAWLIVTWALGFVVMTVWFPTMEELYFRGYLLPRLRARPVAAVVAAAVLFACYHLFTPWMIPVRVVALIPFIAIVRWKKDVRLGIIAHVALNLAGDTLSAIPIVFG